jgi:hypothetical protein
MERLSFAACASSINITDQMDNLFFRGEKVAAKLWLSRITARVSKRRA